MAETGDALRSCMEQLLLVREEKEQIIIEAATKISSEQKKVRDLQQKLEDANKMITKLASENNSLCKTIATKDRSMRELNESKSLSDEMLQDARTSLELTKKQSASLQYEVRVLQKELEIRSKERDYDMRSADAAHRQQAENLRKIAKLEAESQRLRTMVRKRLPGPAALAKMKDEVEQLGSSPDEGRMRRPRTAAPLSTRESASEDFVKLRAVQGENRQLRQLLARRESELQFVQMKYADEACRLSVVQRQLKELSEESSRLDDSGRRSESWASALISELEHFKDGKQGVPGRTSDIGLLDDLVEIEKLEMATSAKLTLRPSTAPQRSLSNASAKNIVSRRTVTSKSIGRNLILDDSLSNNCSEWLQDVLEVIIHKHQVSGISIDTMLEEVTCALKRSGIYAKDDASIMSYDRSKLEKMVANLIEKMNCAIRRSTENNVANSRPFSHEKSEFTARVEYLIHICYVLVDGKANLEELMSEACLILEQIVTQHFSLLNGPNIVQNNGYESLSISNGHDEHTLKIAKLPTSLGMQPEAQEEPIDPSEGWIPDHVLVIHPQSQLAKEGTTVVLGQDDHICQERQSVCCETESTAANGTMEDLTEQRGKQQSTNSESEISAAAEKLAECQETVTIISKQLQALTSPANPDTSDTAASMSRLSSARSDYRPQSLARILAEEDAKTEDFSSPASLEVACKKDHDEPNATTKNIVQEQDAQTDFNADNNGSTQIVVHPTFAKSPRAAVPIDRKKKKRRAGLLSRLIFRRKVESSS